MKERKKCIQCSSNRLLSQYDNDSNICNKCIFVKDGMYIKGKYNGIMVDNIKNIDRSYYDWCIKNIKGFKEEIENKITTNKNIQTLFSIPNIEIYKSDSIDIINEVSKPLSKRSKAIEISKSENYKKCQKILYEIETSNYINDDESKKLKEGDEYFDFLVNVIFPNHNDWENKKGCGIDYIISHKPTHKIYNRYPNFYLIRKDGSKIDISFTKCFKNENKSEKIENDIINACRRSIEGYIETIKNKIKYPYKCPILGEKYFSKDIEAHHQEITFEDIFYEWIKNKDKNYIHTTLDNSGYGSVFTNNDIKNDFINFHNKKCKVINISKKAHKYIHKNKLERLSYDELLSIINKK